MRILCFENESFSRRRFLNRRLKSQIETANEALWQRTKIAHKRKTTLSSHAVVFIFVVFSFIVFVHPPLNIKTDAPIVSDKERISLQ